MFLLATSVSDTIQDVIDFLGHLGTLLIHIQSTVHQYPEVPEQVAAFEAFVLHAPASWDRKQAPEIQV